MPKCSQKLTHWVPDDAPSTRCPFVLADMNREGRIVAASAVPSEWAVGGSVFHLLSTQRHVMTWLTEQMRGGVPCPMLIPVGDAVWTADPRLYLSTGLLLWTRCPASAAVVAALAESRMLGNVVLHPDIIVRASTLPADDETHAAVRAMLSHWDAVGACLPRAQTDAGTQKTVAELLRLIRTVADLCGCEVPAISVADGLEQCTYGAAYDLPMFCAMILLISAGFRRHGMGRFSVSLQDGGEGVAVTITAAVPRGKGIAASSEVAFCRTLAERNRQIFDAETRNGAFCLHMCVVRKDFSLLGIKAESELR